MGAALSFRSPPRNIEIDGMASPVSDKNSTTSKTLSLERLARMILQAACRADDDLSE